MLTSKQRAYLRGLANTIDPIFQIGKSGITPALTDAINDALEARELIKINILKNCFEEPRYLCSVLSERTHSEPVQVIGRKIILFRASKENSNITFPKS